MDSLSMGNKRFSRNTGLFKMKTNIICRLQVEGLHWWSEASKHEPTMVYSHYINLAVIYRNYVR